MKKMTITELMEKAIQVVPGMQIVTELGEVTQIADEWLKSWTAKEKCFGTDNGSVAFIVDGKYFIMPFTIEILEILEKAGFQDESISVAIAGWKEPADPEIKARWQVLKAEQAAARN